MSETTKHHARVAWRDDRQDLRAHQIQLAGLAPMANLEVRLARVSVHDTVEGHRLWDVLEHVASVSPSAIRALVESRVA